MSYTPNIPVTGQSLNNTRDPIRENFQQIQALIAINHEDFGSLKGQGKHKYVEMPTQGSSPTIIAGEGVLYTSNSTGIVNLFWKRYGGTDVQLTGVDPVIGTSTSVFLPGGLIMKFGMVATPGTSGTVVFDVPFPNNIYNVQLTLQHNGANESVVITGSGSDLLTVNQFKYQSTASGASTNLFWVAYGN